MNEHGGSSAGSVEAGEDWLGAGIMRGLNLMYDRTTVDALGQRDSLAKANLDSASWRSS